jgi:hypothetical protein
MKNIFIITLVVFISFCLGFASNTIFSKQLNQQERLKRVTGIGGIFFKCKNPGQMRTWYQTHLGFKTNDYGAVFE